MDPSPEPGHNPANLMLIRSLGAAAITVAVLALVHAQVALSGLSEAFLGVGFQTPWWPRLALFTWLIAGTQAGVALWGAWRILRERAQPSGCADLQAALWLICALHVVQGAGAGTIVPADAPFRPAPLSSVIVVFIATALLSRALARISKPATPHPPAPTDLSATSARPTAAAKNPAEDTADNLATDLGPNRSSGATGDRTEQ
jgi:hypothetical protein